MLVEDINSPCLPCSSRHHFSPALISSSDPFTQPLPSRPSLPISYLFELHLLTLVNSRKMSDVDPRDCVEVSAACPVEESIYGYYPSRPANYFFTIIFGICLIVQLFQGIKWKSRAFAIAMCFGCLGECIGKDSCGHTPSHDGH